MKPMIDMELTFLGKYLSNTKLCNTIKNYWGTEFIDGVEVMKDSFIVYPKPTTVNYTKIANILNLSKLLKNANYSGLSSYYLKFNPSKVTNSVYNFNTQFIVDNLNSYVSVSEYSTSFLNLSVSVEPSVLLSKSKAELQQYILDNYSSLVDQLIIGSGDSILENAISTYLLFDNNQCLDIKFDSINVIAVPTVQTSIIKFKQVETVVYTSKLAVQISYKRKSVFTATSNIVTAMNQEQQEAKQRHLLELANSTSNKSLLDDGSVENTSGLITNDIWYKSQLRASVLKTHTLKRHVVAKLIGESLDTGYTVKKKKKSWWQKILAPVLFIVAVVLAPWTGGTSLAIYWAVVAVGFTVLSFAMAKWGDTVSAEYMGKFAKISGYVATVTGIANFIANMGRQIAEKGLQEYVTLSVEALTSSLSSATSSLQSGSLLQEFTTYVSNNTMKVFNTVTSFVNKVATMWMENRTQRQTKILSMYGAMNKYQDDELAKLTAKEYDIGAEDIKLYTKPLTMDTIQFEVDYLYEPTKFNICRSSFITNPTNFRYNKV